VVVDHEDTMALRCRDGVCYTGFHLSSLRALLRERQPNHELAPEPLTTADCLDRPIVHFDEPLDQRQPDPESALGALEGCIDAHEHLENLGQHFPGDSDAVVDDADNRG